MFNKSLDKSTKLGGERVFETVNRKRVTTINWMISILYLYYKYLKYIRFYGQNKENSKFINFKVDCQLHKSSFSLCITEFKRINETF